MKKSNNNPKHIAIVMDGNGRWAKQRLMPRIAGHRSGVKSVRMVIDFCVENNIEVLSLFALSVENFQARPKLEVQFLTALLSDSLLKNLDDMHRNRVRIRIVGDLSVFNHGAQLEMRRAETVTKDNNGLNLVIAINYSGRWDILQATQRFAQHIIDQKINIATTTEQDFAPFLCLHDLPEPDLLIHTSGEQRISNFMLWQLAYTELFFTNACWPDFDEQILNTAIATFQKRDRRFGKIAEKI